MRVATTIALACCLLACEREQRRFQELAPASGLSAGVALSELHPAEMPATVPHEGPYDDNAFAINEGKRLFNQFNCVGCHGQGGGGMGPPLMDHLWTYGYDPLNIYSSIVEGRPNGMPSFRGKIPDQQVWELVAYVRELGGLAPLDARQSRSDHLQPHEPETEISQPKPVQSSTVAP